MFISEYALGMRAKQRLLVLLNEGPFQLQPIARDKDKYRRDLRVVARDGRSIGDQLVGEGLAQSGAYECAAITLLGPDTGFLLSRGGGTSLASVVLPGQEEETTFEGATPALALIGALTSALAQMMSLV